MPFLFLEGFGAKELIISVAIALFSFVVTYVFIKVYKGSFLKKGIFGLDINKEKRPKIAEGCGIFILIVLWVVGGGLLIANLTSVMSLFILFTVTCFALVGFFTDAHKVFKRSGDQFRNMLLKGTLLFLIALPMAHFTFGAFQSCDCVMYSEITNLTTQIFATIFAALVIVGAAAFTNSFAGLNGWEVGSSSILLGAITIMTLFSATYTATLFYLCLVMLFGTLALYKFNRFPAHVFPGDSGTFMIGSFIGCIALFVGWYYVALLFLPHFYDVYLKGKTNKEDMSQKKRLPYHLKDEKLHAGEGTDYVKTFLQKKPMTEKKVVGKVLAVVGANAIAWTIIYIIIMVF